MECNYNANIDDYKVILKVHPQTHNLSQDLTLYLRKFAEARHRIDTAAIRWSYGINRRQSNEAYLLTMFS